MNKILSKEIKIELLSWDEEPLEHIEGLCISGTISVDGNSAVRRTCSLSLLVKNDDNISADWGISKKIKIYLKANSNEEWINQGLYVVTSFSSNESITGTTISVSAQDKMCLLNGTIGGAVFAETDFGNINTYISQSTSLDGTESLVIQKTELSIFDIIRESLHGFCGEKYENIIIKDIQDGLELLEYRGSDVLIYDKNTNQLVPNTAIEGFEEIQPYGFYNSKGELFYDSDKLEDWDGAYLKLTPNGENESIIKLSVFFKELNSNITINEYKEIGQKLLAESFNHYQRQYGAVYIKSGQQFLVAIGDAPHQSIYNYNNKNSQYYQYGDTIGYRLTPLTYSDKDFILKPGETIQSLLEKIKNKFGMYEYFYDKDGRFVFQKKLTYINFGLQNEHYLEEPIEGYSDKEKIISISSSPNISNIKNDFSIWGTASSKIPFHIRVGIAKRPTGYKSYKGNYYTTKKPTETLVEIRSLNELQWLLSGETNTPIYIEQTIEGKTELILLEDFLKSFLIGMDSGNALEQVIWTLTYIIFLGAMIGFIALNGEESPIKFKRPATYCLDYRELIYQMALDYFTYHNEPDFEAVLSHNNPWVKNGKTGYESFYTDMKEFWPKLYNGNVFLEESDKYILSGDKTGWSKDILNPSSLIFWFELIEGKTEYQIQNIGSRLKAETNDVISAIDYKETPNILFYPSTPETAPADWKYSKDIYKNFSSYAQIQIPNERLEDFVISSKHYSAKELMEQYLYSYQTLAETQNISIIPDYNLAPNSLIKILGETYLIKKLSYSLAYNGTMTLELSKIYNNNLQGDQ